MPEITLSADRRTSYCSSRCRVGGSTRKGMCCQYVCVAIDCSPVFYRRFRFTNVWAVYFIAVSSVEIFSTHAAPIEFIFNTESVRYSVSRLSVRQRTVLVHLIGYGEHNYSWHM